MSIFSTERSAPVSEGPAAADAPRRWRWGAADVIPRTTIAASSVEIAATPGWRRWSPFRTAVPAGATPDAVARAGYRKGVRDEARVAARQRARRHPVIGFMLFVFAALFICAAAGVGFTALAFQDGSFSAAGSAVDQQISTWRGDVLGVAGRAVDQSGQAVQNAGKTLSDKSAPLTQAGH